VNIGQGWELAFGTGHCLLGRDPWLVKAVIGYSFNFGSRAKQP
jgi:hypothetical protein